MTVKFYQSKISLLLKSKLANKRLDQIDRSAVESLQAQSLHVDVAPQKKALALFHKSRTRDAAPATAKGRQLERDCPVPKIKLLRGEGPREFVLSRNLEPTYIAALPAQMRDLAMFLN